MIPPPIPTIEPIIPAIRETNRPINISMITDNQESVCS